MKRQTGCILKMNLLLGEGTPYIIVPRLSCISSPLTGSGGYATQLAQAKSDQMTFCHPTCSTCVCFPKVDWE